MATHPKFARLAHYSRKFGEASHIFLKNGLWQMWASLASPRNMAWQMSASLASPRNMVWQMLVSLGSLAHFRIRPFWRIWVLPKVAIFWRVLKFAKFACQWPFLIINILSQPFSTWGTQTAQGGIQIKCQNLPVLFDLEVPDY
jgi:hypothetical protein